MGGTTVIFCRVPLDAKERFYFEMRGWDGKGPCFVQIGPVSANPPG
jgi:hypothetical protein